MEIPDLGLSGWKDSLDTDKFLFMLILALFGVLWLGLSNIGQADVKLATTIQLFLWMCILAMLGFLIKKAVGSNRFVDFLGMGENFNVAIMALVIGAAAAFIAANGLSFSMAKFSPVTFESIGLSAFMVLLLTNYASPFGEEFIFAGFLQPTLAMHLGQLQGTLLTALLFAGGHFLAYGGNPDQLLAAFIFRLVVSFANSTFNSINFGVGAHFVLNGVN